MSKKLTLITSLVVIILLIVLNIYIYISNQKLSQYVDESNSHTQSIVLIDRFRTDINVMAQAQKLYLLTSKEKYKNQYEENLKNIYKIIDDMVLTGDITSTEKDEILNVVDEYSNINNTTMDLINDVKIDEDVENMILKSNEDQISILEQLDKSIEYTGKNVAEKNGTISENADSQKSGIQTISTIITGFLSSVLVYIKKNSNQFGKEVQSIVKCIGNENDDENINEQDKESQVINKENQNIKRSIEDIIECEKMLEAAKLVYGQSTKIEDKLNNSFAIIKEIDEYLKILKKMIAESEDCYPGEKSIMMRDIEDKFIKLRILFESLPNYNDTILDVYKNMIDKKDLD